MSNLEIILQLLIAVILGGIVGYERERAHKMAGIRTHALVAMGAALVTIMSLYGFDVLGEGYTYDPGRIISNVIVGIGFIGGGAILRKNNDIVVGITTASSLWVVGVIGITVGLGFNYIAFVTALLSYVILTIIWSLERNIESSQHHNDTLEAIHADKQHENDIKIHPAVLANKRVEKTNQKYKTLKKKVKKL